MQQALGFSLKKKPMLILAALRKCECWKINDN